jgi:hypothetical protein
MQLSQCTKVRYGALVLVIKDPRKADNLVEADSIAISAWGHIQ